MLTCEKIRVEYNGAVAVADVDIELGDRTIAAVVGANGAGKSSLGKAIAGITPSTGRITFDGIDLSRTRSAGRVKAGIVYVPEGRRVFSQLTVAENLRIGGFSAKRQQDWRERSETMFERVPHLRRRQHIKAGLLSGGEQQLLAICRALMANPKVLILDEPSLGLAPVAIDMVAEFLGELVADNDLSLLILEQNAAFASRVATHGWLMNLGTLPQKLTEQDMNDPQRLVDVLVALD